MAKTIDDALKNVQVARAIEQHTTSLFRELIEEFRSKQYAINSNRELSDEGKSKQLAKLHKTYEVEAMNLMRNVQDERSKALDEARRAAESVLTAPLPKVDDTKRALFRQTAEELTAKAMFATNPKQAVEALRQLSESADEPALAAEIKPQILQLSQNVVSTAPAEQQLQTKQALGSLYNEVSDKALSQGGRQAREIMGLVEEMAGSTVASPLLQQSLGEISQVAKIHVNSPHDYFDKGLDLISD